MIYTVTINNKINVDGKKYGYTYMTLYIIIIIYIAIGMLL